MNTLQEYELPNNLLPPVKCPHCETQLTLDGEFPYCPNYNCTMRIYGRVQKFVDVLDVKGVGELTLQQLVKRGLVRTPADLFTITISDYTQCDRVGEKHYRKLRDGLDARREMTPAQFFASLDIEGIGTWESICAVPGLQTIDQILSAAGGFGETHTFAKAQRVSEEKARSIIEEIFLKKDDILALKKQIKVKTVGARLQGKVFCITGSLSRPRSELEALIKDNGGLVSSSVTNRTTHLITDDPTSKSGKSKRAQELGIPMINEAQFNEILNNS